MTNTMRIATILLLVSIGTIFINGPTVFLFFKINDLFLIASLFFFVIEIVKKNISLDLEKKLCLFFTIWFGINLVGSIIGFILFKHFYAAPTLMEFGRMIACFLIFIIITNISKYNDNFPKLVLFSLIIPAVFLPLIYLIPNNMISHLEYINGIYTRFTGLFESPNSFAQFSIIPTILVLFFITKIKSINKKTVTLGVIGFFVFCLSVGAIIWSGSRGGIVGLIFSFIIFIFLLARSSAKKKAIICLIIIILSFPLGYLMLPSNAKGHIKSRIQAINVSNSPLTGSQDRETIWKNSLNFILINPFGYGPSYYKEVNITDSYNNEHDVSHNIILQLTLTGGLLLLLYASTAFLNLIYYALINNKKYFQEIHALLAILSGMIIASFFDEFLYVRWLWVIFALVYFYTYKTNSENHPRQKAL